MTRIDLPSPDLSRSPIRAAVSLLIIFVAGLFIYGWRLGDSPLDRTEPFRALVAHHMVTSGDWLIPRLYGEVYLRKPPLIYWIEAAVEKLIGHGDEFVWRLPSAVGSAALAAIMAWFAGRWFGDKARLPSGFACLALLALWDQDRGADIDALNTLAAMLTTLCVLELICGIVTQAGSEVHRRAGSTAEESGSSAYLRTGVGVTIGWTLALGLCLGATLLLKGPGGLPQVIGAVIGPAIVLRNWKLVRRPSIAIGFLIGFAIFAAYLLLAMHAMSVANITPDRTGGYEIIEKIFLHGWMKRLKAIGLPFVLLAYGLPVSLVLPFAFVAIRRAASHDIHRQRAMAILGTLGASLVVWMIVGNDNPRYEYVMLPLLALLVGYVWTVWDLQEPRLRAALWATCCLMAGATVLITLKLAHPHIVIAIITGLVLCTLIRRHVRNGDGLFLVVIALFLLLAIPMAARKNAERQRKSAKNAAAELLAIMGGATRIADAGVVRDMPELFYYSGLTVDAYGENGLGKLAVNCCGQWVILSENPQYPAYSTMLKFIPNAFPHGLKKLHMPDPRDRLYVGFYNPPAGASTYVEMKVQPKDDSDD